MGLVWLSVTLRRRRAAHALGQPPRGQGRCPRPRDDRRACISSAGRCPKPDPPPAQRVRGCERGAVGASIAWRDVPRCHQRGCSWRSTRRCRCARSSLEWALGVARPRRARRAARAGRCDCWTRSRCICTLCFLGSRPVGEIEALAEALAACRRAARASCRWALRCGCRHGGRTRWRWRSTIAWESSPRVQQRVSGAVGSSARLPERRRFRPHITLARVRGRRTRAASGASTARPAAVAQRCRRRRGSSSRRSVVLYRSWLRRRVPATRRWRAASS